MLFFPLYEKPIYFFDDQFIYAINITNKFIKVNDYIRLFTIYSQLIVLKSSEIQGKTFITRTLLVLSLNPFFY
ncbi:hypothetical protein DWV22_06960 [Weissella confusa]|nr:hypothetical protein [Weissella confusa]RGX47726.1 hypothetical protein DWV22_06960 [Weissella confusa]TGE40526.1 hypothetical protein C6P24_09630 [Weissella confusa]